MRVRRGDAAGYAYTEDLSWEALERAARAAGADRRRVCRGKPRAHVSNSPATLPSRASILARRAVLANASCCSARTVPHAQRIHASPMSKLLSESYREVLVATSEGHLARDVQPMLRFGLRVVVEHQGKRQAGG